VNDARVDAGYRADAAFVRRTGFRMNSTNIGYEFQGERTWWVRVRPFIAARALRLPDGTLDESYVDPGADITLARDLRFYVYHSFHRDAFLGREYDYQFDVVNYTINTFKRVAVEGRLQLGEAVHFDPAWPQVGRNLDSSVTVTFKPTAALHSDVIHLRSRLSEFGTGRVLFDQRVYRTRTNYQFTREHAARAIVDYNTRSRRMSVSLLYTYLPRPNTALYAGYGDVLLRDLDPATAARLDGWQRQQRTFFVKLSHNFRR
jgi:hypothetical protein